MLVRLQALQGGESASWGAPPHRRGAMEDARKLLEQGSQYLRSLLEGNDAVRDFQDKAFTAARDVVKSTRLEVARMEAATVEQLEEAKTAAQWAIGEARKYEAEFFDTLKEHRVQSAVVAGTVAVLLLPATHRFVYRRTIGRFRTPEGMVQTAEKRLEDLKQSTDLLKNDASKLQERADLAEHDFLSGRSKLRATSAELRRVFGMVQREESKARGLKELLKELPARDSVRLRSELANTNYELRQQALLLDRKALKISRYVDV